MPAKRGGFLGPLITAAKTFFKPIVNTVSSLFGGAKQAATQVAHNAISRGAQSLQQGVHTGNWKGAARQFARGTRGDARGTYYQQYDHARDSMRRQISERIHTGHRQFGQHMRTHYNQYREHPRWQQHGMRRPPTYNSHFGAGFGKKFFDQLMKGAHKHVGKIFAQAKKAHRAAHTKAGRSKTKAQRKREVKTSIAAAHKEAGAGFKELHKAVLKRLQDHIMKKGAGMAIGAGTKVGAGAKKKGAGTKVGAGFIPQSLLKNATPAARKQAMAAIAKALKSKKGGFIPANFLKNALPGIRKRALAHVNRIIKARDKKGAGTKVGAGWNLSGHWTAGLTKTQIRAEGKRRRAAKKKPKVGAGCNKCDYDK